MKPALRIFAAGLAWAFAGGALAQDGDVDLAVIKAAALDAAVEAGAAQQRLHWPEGDPLDVYLGSDAGAAIDSATASLDGASVVRERFSSLETAAFAAGGWYRITRGSRSGRHNVHVEIRVHATAASAREPLQLDADMAVEDLPPDTVVLAWVERGLFAPELHVVVLRPEAGSGLVQKLWTQFRGPRATGLFGAGGEDDPQLRYAKFLQSAQQYLDAAAVLSGYAATPARSADPHLDVALAAALLAYGLPERAVALQSRWQQGYADEVGSLRVELGEYYYRRGLYRAAEGVLGAAPNARGPALLVWQDLKARLLLAEGRLGEAGEILRAIEPRADYAGYVRYYNLGIALIADGSVAQGLTVLERVGDIAGGDPALAALRDRANLAVGMHFLEAGDGATAIPLLRRVGDGAAGRRAQLGLGWAWLAPAGAAQDRTMLGDERTIGPPPESAELDGHSSDQNVYQRFNLEPFERAEVERSPDAKLRRALAAWSGLLDSPLVDDEAIQASLAIGMHLEDAGAPKGAAPFYEQAIAGLEQVQANITQAGQYLGSEQADTDIYLPDPDLAFDRELHRLPPEPAASLLEDVIAGWPFRACLEDYRDAIALRAQLAARAASIASELHAHCGGGDNGTAADCEVLKQDAATVESQQHALERAAPGLRDRMQQPLRAELAILQRRDTQLLARARLALAQLYDRTKAP